MLDVRKNRLNYGELISPPEGFELSKAVGTTYSLDLFALLAIPVALFYAKSMEGDFQLNRYDVLDAIRQSSDKVDLFCQRGKIIVPKKYSNLFAFMEGCIEEVEPPIEHSSFHPKMWVLRFESETEVRYRLVVLSRNLTFDRSWDIAYFADGKPGNTANYQSKKISDYLQSFYNKTSRKIESGFFKDLELVEFVKPEGFKDFDIFPINKLEAEEFTNPLEQAKYKRLLIISPFIDVTSISRLKKNNDKLILLSREEELDKISQEILEDIDVYCLNNLVRDGESIIDTEGKKPLLQNLHAKVFVGANGATTDWYMGSANCTDPAFSRNAEILVKLSSRRKQNSLDSIEKTLFEDQSDFFQKYIPTELSEDVEKELLSRNKRKLIYELTQQKFIGKIEKNNENHNYKLVVTVDLRKVFNDKLNVKLNLIHRSKMQQELILGSENKLVFDNIAITNLSSYLVVSLYSNKDFEDSLAIKMDIDIPDERESIIFNQLINSKAKFLEYLQFLLSPDQYSNSLIINESQSEHKEASVLQDIFGMNTPIYESLMMAASRSPQKLLEIDRIIKKLEEVDSDVIEDFMPIWNVFKEFAHDR